jgi:thiol:disulfide interchange protein
MTAQRTRILIASVGLLALLGLTQSALAQPGGSNLFGGGAAASQKVTVSAEASGSTVASGSHLTLAVILDHAEHWHTWPTEAQDVLPDGFEFALRTNITLTDAPAWMQVGPIQWPEPSPAPVPNLTGEGPATIEVPTYNGRAIAFVPILLAADAPPGDYSLDVEVFYQACDESTCLPPKTVNVDVPVVVGTLEDVSAAGSDTSSELFNGFDASVYARMQAGEAAPATSDEALVPESTTDAAVAIPGRSFFGIGVPAGDGPVGLLVLALLAAIGGFILNLTPCVLPVIPIKVMTISQHAGTPGKSLYLGLWMAAGVIAFWVGIGLPVAFVAGITDPSRIFGIWWLTLGIGLVIGLMGLGIMGLFAINLPQSVYMVNPKADTAWGSFVFGVMTAVLGLPCFGFVAGALLAGAATLPSYVILTIFAALGVGMASPYLVMSAKPSLVERLPRTGPASELVKQVMGLLLLAAAAYFVGAGLIALVSEQPWMSRQIHWWAVALFAVAAGVWLIVRTVQITKKPIPRLAFGVVAVVISAVAVLYASDSTQKAREIWTARQASIDAAGGKGVLLTSTWIDYSPELLEKARAEGYTVVLDFTAEWCLNCKALKAAVLNREPVKGALASDKVVSMTVDLTSTKAPGWKKLNELGQTGIPLLVVYGPGLEEPWQANAYTSQQVLDALARAGGAPNGADQRAFAD